MTKFSSNSEFHQSKTHFHIWATNQHKERKQIPLVCHRLSIEDIFLPGDIEQGLETFLILNMEGKGDNFKNPIMHKNHDK